MLSRLFTIQLLRSGSERYTKRTSKLFETAGSSPLTM